MPDAPHELDMRTLRNIAASQQPQPHDSGMRLSDIPFGIEIEMENVNFKRAWLAMKIHQSKWKTEHDASLHRGAEAVSPVLRFDDRGLRQIRGAYKNLQKNGGFTTRHCGLHVHVDASVLGDKGLAMLMRMVRENESLLYRIAQNGHPQHRGQQLHPYHHVYHYYAKPFCENVPDGFGTMHAESLGEFRSALYTSIPARADMPRPAVPPANSNEPFHPARHDSARYFAVNFNSVWSRGTVEFRLFDGTDDPEQAIANVQLVLGMVKAAAEGNYTYLQDNPLGQGYFTNNRVDAEQLDNFLASVAPQPELADRLRHTFTAGGGTVTDPQPVRDPAVLRTAWLQSRGYRFMAEGKPVTSALEVQREMARRPVSVLAPGESGPGSPLTAAGLLQLA